MNRILIYNDKGSCKSSVHQLENCFKQIYGNQLQITLIDANYVLNGNLTKKKYSKELLCFGGGYDLGYLESLGEIGCNEIREFVSSGGYYLGICAGAYFATNYIEFDLNGNQEVKGERHLKFFNGKAIGPLNDFVYSDYDDEAIAIRIKLLDKGIHLYSYLNGGCYFEPAQTSINEYKIIAIYDEETNLSNDQKLAIIECGIGNGKCLLSGIHFEYDAYHLNIQNKEKCFDLLNKLVDSNAESLSVISADQNVSKKHTNYELVEYLFKQTFNF